MSDASEDIEEDQGKVNNCEDDGCGQFALVDSFCTGVVDRRCSRHILRMALRGRGFSEMTCT